MIKDAGYTLDNQITGDVLTAYEKDILPTSKNNLENSAVTIEDNSYKGEILTGTNDVNFRTGYDIQNFSPFDDQVLNTGITYFGFSSLVTGNPNNYHPASNGQDFFQCTLTGTYTFDFDLNVFAEFNNSWNSTPTYEWYSRCYVQFIKNGQVLYQLGTVDVYTATGQAQAQLSNTVNMVNTLSFALNAGDNIRLISFIDTYINVGDFSDPPRVLTHTTRVKMTTGDFVSIYLEPELVFGSSIYPSQTLPDIKQSDLFKDTCIRYCLVPYVNEDTRVVSLIPFDSIKENIPNAVDWTDKIDETTEPEIKFDLGNYAQKNNIRHKEDKTVPNIPYGSDSVIGIDNQNLEYEKDLWVSPFAPSETVERLGTDKVMYIDLHDGTGFNNDVEPRNGYVRLINRTIDYWDGTTTTTVTTNIPLTWFIDDDRDYSAGFQKTLLNNSLNLIDVLQRMKILSINIRLNILDILNLNYFYPIKLEGQYNAFFFISVIKQFDYTSTDSTEVELIKIN